VDRTVTWIDGSLTTGEWVEDVRSRLGATGVDVTAPNRADDTATGIVLLDALSPPALEHLAAAARGGRRRVVVLVTAPDGLPRGAGWRLLEHGATDVLSWRPGLERALSERLRRWVAVAELVASDVVAEELVGSSPAWIRAVTALVEIAHFSGSALLITGESGTGKELAARLVHHLDPRVVRGPLVVVDCTTVVASLSGSEFFGHEKGAFTGAHSAREGAFAAADGGTLFLDEVGELPLTLQAELLRVVQEGTYKRVGGNDWRHTSFRLVCATNRNLVQEVEKGQFRPDLYYRIAAASLRLPPLRERHEDVLPLFSHFVRAARGTDLEVDPEVCDLLQGRAYPGNVRDLRQLTLRVLARHVGDGPITVGDVPQDERPGGADPPARQEPGADLKDATPAGTLPAPGADDEWDGPFLDALIRAALDRGLRFDAIRAAVSTSARRVALQRAGGSQKRAADLLGVTPRALQKQRQRTAALAAEEASV
jgi:transcriptional regulator with GAF, ATPase, and Fis domain